MGATTIPKLTPLELEGMPVAVKSMLAAVNAESQSTM